MLWGFRVTVLSVACYLANYINSLGLIICCQLILELPSLKDT